MIETLQRTDIKSRSPYIKILSEEIFPIIREHIKQGRDEVIFKEEDIRKLLKIDEKVLTLSVFNRLKILSKSEFDVGMGTHNDGTRLLIFWGKTEE